MMSTGVAHAAASVAAGAATYSKEGLTLSGTTPVDLPIITVTFGNALTYQDDVFITIPGITSVAAIPSPTLVTCTPAIVGNPAPSVGYVTTINGGWAFRVTSVAGVTIGDTCTFGDAGTPTFLQAQGASLANSSGTISYRAYRFQTGQLVDSADNTTSITIKSQFGVHVTTALNATIDVYKDRLAFVDDETVGSGAGAANPDQADTLQFETTVDANGTVFDGPVVTVDSQTATIGGDFNWSDTAAPAGTCFDSGIVAFAGWSVASTSNCASLVLNGPTGNTTNDGYFYVPGNKILNPTDYTGAMAWKYHLGSATGTTSLSWDPGIWDINGAQVYIQYMPYGTGISRIIYAANRGPIDADATADIYYGGSVHQCAVGAVNHRTVNELSGAIDACVAGMGITAGKVAILLTFTAPDSDIEVYSAYNVGGSDRGTVVNTSNGRTFFYGTGFPFTPPL